MAKVFSLEVLDAKHGDALLLHWGSPAKPKLMVIDGGPSGVWARALSKRLDALQEKRGTPLSIALMMVSHVDDDHIRGLLDLTDRMERAADEGHEPPYVIDELWFNAFDDIVGNVEVAAFKAPVSVASLAATAKSSGAVLATVGQGRTLRDRASRLGVRLNGGDRLIEAGWEWELGDGLSFTVIAPSRQRIEEFQKEWDKKVRANGWATRPAAGEIAAFIDDSPYNLASIVVLAKLGSRSMLLTGDARGDDILEGLDELGLLGSRSLTVDILKLPHHGSDRNVTTDFFRKVKARHYVVSGDGRHGNPEIATLRMITEARGGDSYTVHCTYRDGIDGFGDRLTEFLESLPASRRRRFAFRKDGEPSITIQLGASL
ncbi:MAG: hypothetical protein HC882_05405 [Acidobacteria bacterium]|nr:hypothetical protein [Acidobacteriota bacterium]